MADTIPCDGVHVPWYRWRRRRRWFFLWVSDDDRQELTDLLAVIGQNNMQDLQNRYDAATCDPPECRKDRTRFETAPPAAQNSYIRCRRPFYGLGLFVRCVVYSRLWVEVWCEG